MEYDAFEIVMLIKELYADTIGKINENLKDSKLTYQQVMIIKIIAYNDEINVSKLCEEMSLSKATVSGIIKRLEKLGYIDKVKYSDDKRHTYVRLSEMGSEFANESKLKIDEIFDSVFNNFTVEEILDAKKTLIKIKDKIKG